MKYGVIDVGSNTIRLILYHCQGTAFRPLLDQKETAGLAGFVSGGILTPAGVEVLCQTLGKFQALLADLDVPRFSAFATASLRNIQNSAAVLSTVRARLGLELHLLSGEEEARLSFLGATLGPCPPTGVMVDLGGGSTELFAFQDGRPGTSCSLPLGSLSLYTACVSGLFPTADEAQAIRSRVSDALDASPFSQARITHLVGVGGTIRSAWKLCPTPGASHRTAAELHDLLARLSSGDRDALHAILAAAPDRVHTLLPGLLILDTILTRLGVETLSLSTWGVREGYLLTYVPQPW